MVNSVIPVKAGIQAKYIDSRLRGNDKYCLGTKKSDDFIGFFIVKR